MPTPGNMPRRRERGHGRSFSKPPTPGQINTAEEITPRRLWVLARKALECGWAVTAHKYGDNRYMLILTERHHCIHVQFVEREFEGRRWNIKRNIVHTRCPAALDGREASVRLSGLTEYLEVHPAQCAAELAHLGDRPDLWDRVEKGEHQSCDYHLPMGPWEVRDASGEE